MSERSRRSKRSVCECWSLSCRLSLTPRVYEGSIRPLTFGLVAEPGDQPSAVGFILLLFAGFKQKGEALYWSGDFDETCFPRTLN